MGAQSIVSSPNSVLCDLEGRTKPRYAFASLKGARPQSLARMLSSSDERWAKMHGLDLEEYQQWRQDSGLGPSRRAKQVKQLDEPASVGKARWLEEEQGLSRAKAENAARALQTCSLENITEKAAHLEKELGVGREEVGAMVSRWPQLLNLTPANITEKVEHLGRELGVGRANVARVATRQPTLLMMSAERLSLGIRGLLAQGEALLDQHACSSHQP